MIVNHERKVAILLTPKTGSVTIKHLFKQWFVSDYGSHPDYSNLKSYLISQEKNIEEYKVYAFHRDPVERTLSGLNSACMSFIQLAKDRDSVQEFLDIVYPNEGLIAPPVAKNDTDVSNIEPLYRFKFGSTAMPSDILQRKSPSAVVVPQLPWVGDRNIKLLAYESYSDNVKILCDEMGVDVPTPIPVHNKSIARWSREELPQSEVDFVKEYYKDDYAFFESVGIIY